MTTGVARAVRLAPARTCVDCNGWPCRCDRGEPGFPEFALRVAPCACGGPAIAGGGMAENVRRAVEAHNATPEHRAWREAMGL